MTPSAKWPKTAKLNKIFEGPYMHTRNKVQWGLGKTWCPRGQEKTPTWAKDANEQPTSKTDAHAEEETAPTWVTTKTKVQEMLPTWPQDAAHVVNDVAHVGNIQHQYSRNIAHVGKRHCPRGRHPKQWFKRCCPHGQKDAAHGGQRCCPREQKTLPTWAKPVTNVGKAQRQVNIMV